MECLFKCIVCFQVFEEFSSHELLVSSTYIKKCEDFSSQVTLKRSAYSFKNMKILQVSCLFHA